MLLVLRGTFFVTAVGTHVALARGARKRASSLLRLSAVGKTARYVLALLDRLLGVGEREKCFHWAQGDPSPNTQRRRKLPFDGVWETHKLIVEIDEDQHGKATPFFDKPDRLTISGMDRRQQRAMYDARKREAAKQAGYTLLAITWPRNKKQRPIEDKAELLQRLREARILPPEKRPRGPRKRERKVGLSSGSAF